MVRSLYVMPIITDATGKYPQRYPKYYKTTFPALSWSMFDYGNEPWCLIGIQDVPAATDSALVANADVFALPANLDQAIGSVSARNTVRNALENVNMPGTWIQTTDTYRTVVRFVGALCTFMQCYQGKGLGLVFSATVTLATTFATLSAAQQQALIDCATYFGLSASSLVGANTLRTILKTVGDAFVASYAAGTNPLTQLELEGPL